jgi:hypothetical protein
MHLEDLEQQSDPPGLGFLVGVVDRLGLAVSVDGLVHLPHLHLLVSLPGPLPALQKCPSCPRFLMAGLPYSLFLHALSRET